MELTLLVIAALIALIAVVALVDLGVERQQEAEHELLEQRVESLEDAR